MPQLEERTEISLPETSLVSDPLPQTSQWTFKNLFENLRFPNSGIGLFIVSTVGLTIIGTTTHFIWTRLSSKRLVTEEEDESTEEELLRQYFEKRNQRLHKNDIP